MIVAMSRVRVMGPRRALQEALRALQDVNVLHLAPPPALGSLEPVRPTRREEREARHLRRLVADAEAALAALPPVRSEDGGGPRAGTPQFARWARSARRAVRETGMLRARAASLEEERSLLLKYREMFAAFRPLLAGASRWPNGTAYHVLLRARGEEPLADLRRAMTHAIGDAFELRARPLGSGETALLILIPTARAPVVERLMAQAQVREIPVPAAYGGATLSEALPRMLARLEAIPGEIGAIERARRELAAHVGTEILRARRAARDRLAEIEALSVLRITPHAFVLEGWLPRRSLDAIARVLGARCGDTVVLREEAREEWTAEEAPVVLSNPRLLRPFEVLLRILPLPRYGSIDPTPFLALFFPLLFGMILGDVAHGLLLAALALVLRARSRPGSVTRSVAEIGGVCAAFAILFGLAYGELLGNLGSRWFGLRPFLFDRGEALVPFLLLSLALGGAHVLLGLLLGAAASLRRRPRHAAGRGVEAASLLLVAGAILAATGVLPRAFFTPTVVALLAAVPLLIALEGLMAPIELLRRLGSVLSYARVMALGTASVLLSVVANRLAGALGSAVVGVLFALLFHLVNFALGLFGPAIHALRLHYVEFFGTFYSPGGVPYRPFGRFRPEARSGT